MQANIFSVSSKKTRSAPSYYNKTYSEKCHHFFYRAAGDSYAAGDEAGGAVRKSAGCTFVAIPESKIEDVDKECTSAEIRLFHPAADE